MSQTESVLEDSSSSVEEISLLLFNSRESSLHTSQFYFTTDSPISEYSTQKSLPIDMKYNDGHRLAIVAYTLLMITSAIGNITVLAEILGESNKRKFNQCFQPGSSHVSVSPRTTASQKDILHTNEPKRVSSASARPSTRSLSISTPRFNRSSQGRGFPSQYPVSGTVQTVVVSRDGKGTVNNVKNSEMKCFNDDERGQQRSYLTSMV
ncbi:unnamed protein product [Orchesella dallaii]|uniref:Uncharacterized protein n=1 Tax=Orchesella dallaii TaxID=48710 RepID=A0ABP1S0A5_9HEXA